MCVDVRLVRVWDIEWCVNKWVIIHLSVHSTLSHLTSPSTVLWSQSSSFGESRWKWRRRASSLLFFIGIWFLVLFTTMLLLVCFRQYSWGSCLFASFHSHCWGSETTSCTNILHCCLSLANCEHSAKVLFDEYLTLSVHLHLGLPCFLLPLRFALCRQLNLPNWLIIT